MMMVAMTVMMSMMLMLLVMMMMTVMVTVPAMVTLRISHPAKQATQVTIGDITLHSGMQEAVQEGAAEVVSSRQLLLVPGTYLVDVLARAQAGSTSVAYSLSVAAPQEGGIGSDTWLSLVAQ